MTLLGLDRSLRPEKDVSRPQIDASEEKASPPGRVLRCRTCAHEITTAGSRIEVGGQHAHVFFNPAGVLYRIGCFSDAPGCVGVGSYQSEFAWFAGHLWQIVSCGACRQHMGWRFARGERGFHGLVLAELVEDAAPNRSP